MFSCSLCEGSEYEASNGFFFCLTCGTESQDLRDQKVEHSAEEFYQGSGWYNVVRKVSQDKTTFVANKYGRPWTIYEAFQCIILAQCDALIELGAKPELKDIVYTIWANYLSKLKVAFIRMEQFVPDIVLTTGLGRRRELLSGTLAKPMNKSKKGPKKKEDPTTVGSKRKWETDSSSDSSSDEEESTLVGNDVRGLQMLESGSSDSDSDLDSATFVKKSRSRKDGLKNNDIKRRADWMDLKKTVVLCYMGLRYSNPEILLVQFLRWIYEGKVPYMSTTHLLKNDMVLSIFDPFMFFPKQLKIEGMIEDMIRMSKFLSLETFPNPPVMVMMKELISRLHLPDELESVCGRLHSRVPFQIPTTTRFWKPEFVAMKYIALALKMIFGLDDTTEGQLSEYSEKLQGAISSGGNLFVWSQWRSCQMEHEEGCDLFRDITKKRKFKYQHLDEILLACQKFHREKRQTFVRSSRTRKFRDCTKDFAQVSDALSNPIGLAVSRHLPKPKKIDSDESRSQKFKESTLSHIVNIDIFETRFKDDVSQQDWKKLMHKRRKALKNLVYKKYNPRTQAFPQHRANAYVWLLQFLSDFIGYSAVELDRAVIDLETQLLSLVHEDSVA